MEHVEGDMFDSVPQGDAIILKVYNKIQYTYIQFIDVSHNAHIRTYTYREYNSISFTLIIS